jgi:signal transduction histidine kinase
MERWRMKPRHYVVAAAISFLIAAISFSGFVLREAVPCRFIFGAAWSAVGIAWSSRYYYARLRAREREVRDLRENLLAQARDTAAQQERNRLARELHDSIKQQIFSISMGAAAVQARWDTDPQGARDALDDVRRSAQEAMAEMNALLQQLSPAPLEKVGLVQALREQCEALGYRTDADVTMAYGEFPPDDRLPMGVQESLFRIAQEALSNVARHARAGHVRLYVGQRDADGPLTLEVQDDGQGFQVDAERGGMGLENIRQRVCALGGAMALESVPDEGTTLHVTIPLVKPLVSSKQDLHRQDHTLNKTFLVGLGGGLILIATLFYPLYVLVPGLYVEGWPTGSTIVGLALEVTAAMAAVATGVVVARWVKTSTRQSGTLLGALAGGVAGVVLYFGIGASAADVIGASPLLERGLIPAGGRADVIHLLAESTVRIVGWSHGTFWAALLVGTGLGAIGGFFAPPATAPSHRPDLRLTVRAILTPVAVVSAFSLLTAVSRFGLLEPTMYDGLAMNAISPEAIPPLARISDWLVGTPVLIHVTLLVALYFLLRSEIMRINDPTRLSTVRATAALLALVALGVPVYLGAIGYPTLPDGATIKPPGWMDVTGLPHPSPASIGVAIGAPLLALMLVSGVAMGGLYLSAIYTVHRRQCALGLSTAHPDRTVAIVGILLSLGIVQWAISVPPFWCILIGLALVAVAITLVVRLLRSPRRPISYSPSYVITMISLLLSPIIVGWTLKSFSLLGGAVIGLVLILANLALAVNMFHLSKQSSSHTIMLAQLRSMISQTVRAGLGSAVGMTVPPMTVISTLVGVGLITNQFVEVLVGYTHAARDFTLVALVRNVYLMQARACLITFVVAAATVGLLTLIASGIVAIPEQLAARDGT